MPFTGIEMRTQHLPIGCGQVSFQRRLMKSDADKLLEEAAL